MRAAERFSRSLATPEKRWMKITSVLAGAKFRGFAVLGSWEIADVSAALQNAIRIPSSRYYCHEGCCKQTATWNSGTGFDFGALS